VNAVKNDGKEGFIIPFYYFDSDNRTWFNIGGWGNTGNGIQQKITGNETVYWANQGVTYSAIENGVTYKIKIVVTGGTHVKAYINDVLNVETDIKICSPQRYLYTSGNVTSDGKSVYLRVINPYADAQTLSVKMAGKKKISGIGGEVLTSSAKTDENTMDNQTNVVPKAISGISYADSTFSMTVPAYSAYFFTINIDDVTGIRSIDNNSADGTANNNDNRIYNLNGQRVNSYFKGIIIKNNKKYIVR
jgi:alpha-L-arabinofuranosidase